MKQYCLKLERNEYVSRIDLWGYIYIYIYKQSSGRYLTNFHGIKYINLIYIYIYIYIYIGGIIQ